MSRLTRDGTAEPVSRDQILRHARGQGNVHFPCSADHEQDWQPYRVDPYSAICDDHTYIHTYIPCRAVNSKNVWFLQSFLVLDADEVLFGFYLAIQRLRASTDGAEMVFKCEALSNRQGVSRATD